ncbi:helix-turn-helix domain-containing protein [Paenibacillus sp. SYP-B3998]|uniref:Helix-turn-helix domain-containing protein n=1 Tax=Paenibacillus sp. SYP-B3998 TaxID=2678564 RepID=A0A6G4A4H5_9BACL|nr:helix-turn-helix domain-containing protein [Paenibacillus sp. SYP-B3998]NEW09188.1 helix-turn-helix domain-containing protein [Paenibacillus sp. SYP-B3998]
MKVVIIDDEYWTRDSIRRLAEWGRLGIDQIEEAEDGLSGLSIIGDIHPDIVITDMKMRGMDGTQLLQKLSEDYPFIRKIVISGYDDFSYTKQAILSKVDEYILKPINPKELNRALDKAVRELRIARGLHTVQPLDKEVLKIMTGYKQAIIRNFQELQIGEVRSKFRELGIILRAQEPVKPGVNNSLYKLFMLLLEEHAFQMSDDSSCVIPAQAGELLVTDDTPIEQWIDVLSESYISVMEELIHRRKNKSRFDIEEIREYIDRSFTEPITLESISTQFFVSKEHLSRTFKQKFGSTVMDYIITQRIEKAKKLLQDPLISIKYAAEMVGYSDLTYFHRMFKKITGMTPGQTRPDNQN